MNDPDLLPDLLPDLVRDIASHMNEDHADAVLLFPKVQGNAPNATAARLAAIAPSRLIEMTRAARANNKSTETVGASGILPTIQQGGCKRWRD